MDILNGVDAALDGWLTAGRFANTFEADFARYFGAHRALLVNSGSSANLVAFYALTSPKLGERAIKPGDEVITTAYTYTASASVVEHVGAKLVLVDVAKDSYEMDYEKLADAITEKTKAVMIAHTLGNPFDLQKVKEFCDRHNLWLVEDNCDALGSRYELNGEWHFTGTIGDIGTSSFYPYSKLYPMQCGKNL